MAKTIAISTLIFLLNTMLCWSQVVPPRQDTHIEVEYESARTENIPRFHNIQLVVRDPYSNTEQKVTAQHTTPGVFSITFPLYHPLYGTLTERSAPIPFYVEPGDHLIITIGTNGTLSYRMADGSKAKCENLLKHDISRRTFYNSELFENDKRNCRFPMFADKLMHRLDSVLHEVDSVADTYHFSDTERQLAQCNTKMQFATWLFEFVPVRSVEISSYGIKNSSGWQAREDQDCEMRYIEAPHNYEFLTRLSLNDSTCLASEHFPLFIQNYEHTHFLNHDQYLYYGETPADFCRMDSAYIAKECQATRQDTPSLFMNVALARRELRRIGGIEALDSLSRHHSSSSDSIKTIKLQEVEVVSLVQFRNTFGEWTKTPEDFVRTSWAHDVNLRGVISSLINRRKIANYKKARKLIERLSKDDNEREALMKAYQAEMERRKAQEPRKK